MKRYAQTVLLKDDQEIIRCYDAYHAHPWPEIPAGLRACGVRRPFIYRFERQLFMFMETIDVFDPKRDWPRYMEDPKAREWDEMMSSFQQPVPGAPKDSIWATMKEVFTLDG
jgi:L-rhamnose mutarotase